MSTWRTPRDFSEWMRAIERRLRIVERRKQVGTAFIDALAPASHVRVGATNATLGSGSYASIGATSSWTLANGGSDVVPPHFTVYEQADGNGLTAQVAGLFRISGFVVFAGNATGNRYLRIGLRPSGGSLTTLIRAGRPAMNTTGVDVSIVGPVVRLAVGDALIVQAWQDSGGNLTLQGGNGSRQVALEYLGP